MIIPGDQSPKRSCLHDKACDLDPRQNMRMKRSEIRMFLELRELQSNGAIRRYYQREVKIKVTSESCLHEKACDLDPRQKHEDEAKQIRMFLEFI